MHNEQASTDTDTIANTNGTSSNKLLFDVAWHRAVISNDAEPVVLWRPVYDGIWRESVLAAVEASVVRGDVVRLIVRARED